MGNSIFGIGISGLQAAQAGLLTAGHNIANANTPGFNRQQVVQTNALPQMTGAGFIGNGTQIDTVQRMYRDFLAGAVLSSTSQSSALDVQYSQMKQLDNLLADPSAGLSPALQDFFTSVQNVAAYPSSVPARQSLLSSGAALQARFQTLDQRFTDLHDGVNKDISSTVQTIGTYATQIADLNQRIVVARNSAGGQPPNDLMDQRDQLITELNSQIRATVVVQDDGAYNVFIGSGQPLVAGTQAYGIDTMRDPLDPGRITVGHRSSTGLTQLPENSLTGGRLGGLLAFRSQSLEPAQNALGRVAITLAESFNQQHNLGQDLNGALGQNFFSYGAPQVTASTRNTGTAQITGAFDPTNPGGLTTSDYRLTYDGANYTLTRLSDNNSQTFATLPQTVDGFTLSLGAGAPAAGDVFQIRPTAAGAGNIGVALSDPNKIAAAAPIRTAQGAANLGTGKVDAGVVNALGANLQQPVTITFDNPPTTFSVNGVGTGNPAGVPYVPGQNISFNGWTIQISGTPVTGDTFSVGPNTSGSDDRRNGLLLAGLQTQKIVNGGTASYQSAYSSLVSQVGNQTNQLQVTSSAQGVVLDQAKQAQQSFSGVNIDEEAANLMRYQQAYQASGRVLQIASTLFDTLLQLGK